MFSNPGSKAAQRRIREFAYNSGNIFNCATSGSTNIPLTVQVANGSTVNVFQVATNAAYKVANTGTVIFQVNSTAYTTLGNTTVNLVSNSTSININGTTINSTLYNATSNSANYIGALPAANVVSNAQLSANLANYLTLAGTNSNIAAYLPTYTGVLNASSLAVATSLEVGNSTVNTVANGASILLTNSTSSIVLSIPSAANASSTFYLSGAGSYIQIPVINGSITTTGTSAQNVDSWSITSFHGAKYVISILDNNANNHYFTEVALTHDTNNAYVSEYVQINTNTAIGSFVGNSNSTAVILQVVPVSTNTTIFWSRIIV
jgi:hypothetical protein